MADRCQFCLGVSHGGGWIGVDRTKVAMAREEGIAAGEVLDEAHEGVVDRLVAVGVVFTQYVPDDAGGLAEGAIGYEAQLMHGVQDAPMDGF